MTDTTVTLSLDEQIAAELAATKEVTVNGYLAFDGKNWGIYDLKGKRVAFNADRALLMERFVDQKIVKVLQSGITDVEEVSREFVVDLAAKALLAAKSAPEQTLTEEVGEALAKADAKALLELVSKLVRQRKLKGSVSTALNIVTLDLSLLNEKDEDSAEEQQAA